MSTKDYFKFFTSLGGEDGVDYLISFDVKKPNISNYSKLLELGTWNTYSDSGYRLTCKLTEIDLLNLIHSETKIDKQHIHVICPANNVWIR